MFSTCFLRGPASALTPLISAPPATLARPPAKLEAAPHSSRVSSMWLIWYRAN